MKQITTKNTVEMFASVPSAIGTKKIILISSGMVVLGSLSFLLTAITPIGLTILSALLGFWLGEIAIAKSRWTRRLSLKSLIFHELKKKTMDSYDSMIANNLEFVLKGVNTYKGLWGELRIPVGKKFDANDPTVYLVINKGRIYYEEYTSVSALEMWDKALDTAFTAEEAESLPTHFSDKGYCELKTFEEKLTKDWERHKLSNNTCMSERAELLLRGKDTGLREKIKFSCGCKDCTPSFLRCTACDKTSIACKCLETEKHGITPRSITAA